jgi:hypothetical protein
MAKRVPQNVKDEVLEILEKFNKKHKTSFQIGFRANYAYLSTIGYVETKIARLRYTEDMDKWGFDVFKYSREFYDPDEFMFPGAEELDGTIEGALRAGIHLHS